MHDDRSGVGEAGRLNRLGKPGAWHQPTVALGTAMERSLRPSLSAPLRPRTCARIAHRAFMISAIGKLVASQLTVVMNTISPQDVALHVRAARAVWLVSTGRWHMKRQQCADGPTMTGDASSHGRRRASTSVTQTRVWSANVIDRADQIPAMPQGQCAARQCPTAAGQRCHTRHGTACAHRASQPQAGAHYHGEGHPHEALWRLDTYLIGLHLPE